MRVWRIVLPIHVSDPLSGAGAARWGNRWNSVGVRMGYASLSRPLAVLEALVHGTLENLPLNAVLLPIDVPGQMVAEAPKLPDGWNELPYSPEARRIGDRWVEQSSSLAMLVPSAVLPAERNMLINPRHPHFNQIKIGEPEPGAFDRRLFGG